MRVKDELSQAEQTKTRRKMGFGLSKRTIGRFKKSFKRDKSKSQARSNDKIDPSDHVDSTTESRDKLQTRNQAGLSHSDTRTTVPSHLELPNPQQKELLQLTNENTMLQEQINKENDNNKRLKHEILQQRMDFQQQKNDLEQQIQNLKQEIAASESARMEMDSLKG